MMATWNVPAKLPYALFVAGNERLASDSRVALDRVLDALAKGPPPAVELGTWIAQNGRMGAVPLGDLRAQLPAHAFDELEIAAQQKQRFATATHGMLIAPDDAAGLDPRAVWGVLVLAAAVASAADGVVYDSGTFRVLPQWIMASPLDGLLLGSIKNHVAIVSSTDAAARQTTTTLGLNKYGLFELQLDGVRAPARKIGMLIAGLAQALVDARPTSAGPWDVPASFDVSRLHVAHAFATEIAASGGRTRLGLAPSDDANFYWAVRAPVVDDGAASLGADSFEEAIRVLDIGALVEDGSDMLASARSAARQTA